MIKKLAIRLLSKLASLDKAKCRSYGGTIIAKDGAKVVRVCGKNRWHTDPHLYNELVATTIMYREETFPETQPPALRIVK